MKAANKVSFSKFFPENQQYVVIKGHAKAPDDFSIMVNIGDGENKTSFYIDPWMGKDPTAFLRNMREAMQQALDFYESTMALPPLSKSEGSNFWKDLMKDISEDEKPEANKKPTAKKKKAAPKK